MSQPALKIVDFSDYGDGPPEDTQYECPYCEGTEFQVWTSLYAVCVTCDAEVELDATDGEDPA